MAEEKKTIVGNIGDLSGVSGVLPITRCGTGRVTAQIAKDFTMDKVIKAVLERIKGGSSVRAACEAEGIARTTFTDNVTPDQYAYAREMCADYHFDGILEMADDLINSDKKTDANAYRVALDAKKWAVARMHVKKYGEKVDLTSSDKSMSPAPAIDLGNVSPDNLLELARVAFKDND